MNSTRILVSSVVSRPMTTVHALPTTPMLPEYPHDNLDNPAWVIDMNYLMPFSVMLMILCVLLLILCYLRHRMRQRRQLQRELRLGEMLRSPGDMRSRLDEFGLPTLQGRMAMMYPPTYDEATLHQNSVIQKHNFVSSESPPPYSESAHQQLPPHVASSPGNIEAPDSGSVHTPTAADGSIGLETLHT